jgi:capsule biosynthesis phosphatase
MRIIIDIDGTITELKKHGQTYATVRINPGAAEHIRALKAAGHTIILQTARHMKTCGGDQGQVVAKVGKPTLDWLAEQEIPYDEIYFGKPYGDVYIDDLALPFMSWDSITPASLDDTKINLLIPMAGAGSRFVKAGYTDPKPLIMSHGKTLIEWAVASFDSFRARHDVHLIFVILDEHNQAFGLGDKLRDLFGADITVLSIPTVTSGQAATCLVAKPLINNFNQLIIYNCDTYTTGNEAMLDLIEAERPDGILACFDATDPRYSYARVDDLGYVDLTTEKDPVSNHASTGLYYFRRGQDFVRASEAMIESGETAKGEHYVAPCYNNLLKAGKKVKIYTVKDNWVLGTPDELDYFNANYKPL